jgi:hypothetical protein
MEYSVHNLSEVTDCDSLLAWAQNEKGDLELIQKDIWIEEESMDMIQLLAKSLE